MIEKKEKSSLVKTSEDKKEKKETKKEESKKIDFGLNLKDMNEAGLFFGHRTSRIHPKMKPYIAGTKNTTHIINLEETIKKFNQALGFIEKLISEDKTLLFVGTKIQVKDMVKKMAEECKMPYVSERWIGGTFTNFKTIKKRIDYFKDLENKRKSGELEKYTKKERHEFDREIRNLEIKFKGIKNLEKLPDAIFVLDMRKDGLTIKEARRKGIKIIALADTNVDPTLADFPIPANDDAISSVKYILEKIKKVILKAKSGTSK